jgi:hypothetical protein
MVTAIFKHMTAGALLLALGAGALAADHPPVRRTVDLPPPAELTYKIEARQRGITLSGEAVLDWRADSAGYSISNLARAQLLGKILETRSEGTLDDSGLAPTQFHEKRFRKAPTTVTFDRAGKAMSFSDGEQTYALTGGEQDRSSVQFQLAGVARAAPEKFVTGSEWTFFVAGRRDAEQWVFKVQKRETIKTGLGTMQAVHLVKLPPADSKEQHIDLWLAPSLEWYPVKLRFSDDPGEYVEQTLEKLAKK